jgi:integrase/recombinase XerD
MARRNRERSAVVVAGPLAPFADDYKIMLAVRGYCSRSVVCEVNHLARLSRWMEERRLRAADLSMGLIEEFLGGLPRRRDGGRVCSRRALIQVLEVLDDHGVQRSQADNPASPSQALLASFERFLLRERAVAPSTASVYVVRARRFLDWCAPSGELAGVTAGDVTGAVLRVSASASLSTTKLFVTSLRSFLRFGFV